MIIEPGRQDHDSSLAGHASRADKGTGLPGPRRCPPRTQAGRSIPASRIWASL